MKNVWIFNHYATNTFLEHGGRHFELAKNILRAGYNVRVFCSSTVHNTDKNLAVSKKPYKEDFCEGIPYVFVKARNYKGNGIRRILNMLDYYLGLFFATKHFEKPDVIIGSSVHPLACVAALRFSRKFKCRCIVEIRDLWPESFVAYGLISKSNPLLKPMYAFEKRIYAKADATIFTMEGGRDYIIEKHWDTSHGGPIDLGCIYNINNGVDLEEFKYNKENFILDDPELDDMDTFKVVYTGSIRMVNRVGDLLDVAAELKKRGIDDVKILLYGSGDYVDEIADGINKRGLDNIILKGLVEKRYIPFILSKSDLNVYLLNDSPLYKFGLSLNKLFEYFASGKPVLASAKSGYSLIDRYSCGVTLDAYTPERFAEEVIRFKDMPPEQYKGFCTRAKIAASDYDYKALTKKLIDIIEGG